MNVKFLKEPKNKIHIFIYEKKAVNNTVHLNYSSHFPEKKN